MALILAGCGQGSANMAQAIRQVRAAYGAVLPSRITAAQASASNYALPVPAVPVKTEPYMKPWVSMTGVVPPPNWSQYVPNIPVVNDTNGVVSDTTAQQWGDALMRLRTLQYWGERYFDPNLLFASTPESGMYTYGGFYSLNQMKQGTSVTFAGLMYPEELVLLPLTTAQQKHAFMVPVTSQYVFFVPQVTKLGLNFGTQITRNIKSGIVSRVKAAKVFAQSYLIAGNYATAPNNPLVKIVDKKNPIGWPFGSIWNATEISWCQGIGMTPTLYGLCQEGERVYS